MKKISKKELNNREQNKKYRTLIKNDVKNFEIAMKNSSKDSSAQELQKILSVAQQHLDKSVQKGIIHKNSAARKKSKLFKLFNSFVSK